MNVAVVGCGYWGPNLVRNFSSLPGIQVSLCCDRDLTRRERIERLYPNTHTTADFDDVVDDDAIDAVAIATPVNTHFEIAQACLSARKHVLIEKPMAASILECERLIEMAEKAECVLMVGHTFEYSATVRKVREIILSGELGDVLYISIARLNLGLFRSDINVIWDLAPHDISILLYLMGKEPIAVSGQGKAHYQEGIEDVAAATLHFDKGEIAFLHNSWLDPCKVRKATIVGKRKMLVYDDVAHTEKIKVYDKGVSVPAHYESFGDFHLSYRYGDIYSPLVEETEPLRVECQHFVDCIENGVVPNTDGRSGERVVRILEAITWSMRREGAYVDVR